MRERATNSVQPAGAAGLYPWLAPDREHRRLLQAAVLLAVAVHLWLFALNWPQLTTRPAPEAGVDNIHVLKLQEIHFAEPKPLEEVPKPRKKVQMPALRPNEPEIIERQPVEQIDIPWDGQAVLGVIDEVPPPPAPPAPAPRIVDVGEIEAPRVLGRVEPAYTRAAIDARLEGAVILELVIGEDGTVESVRVLRSLPLGLTERAVAAVRRWRFEPSTLDGRPIKVRYRLTVHFQLR